MKKLMIAAAIVCAAAMSHAAIVKWQVTSMMTPTDPATETKALGQYTTTSVGANATMYALIVGSDVFGATAVDSIYENYGDQLRASSLKAKTNMGTATISSGGSYGTGDTIYALILTEYTANDKTWYVANKAQATISAIDSVAQDGLVKQLNTYIGGTGGDAFSGSGTAITGWTKAEAVPEPTSAMLLLLGMAGLALRRRRA